MSAWDAVGGETPGLELCGLGTQRRGSRGTPAMSSTTRNTTSSPSSLGWAWVKFFSSSHPHFSVVLQEASAESGAGGNDGVVFGWLLAKTAWGQQQSRARAVLSVQGCSKAAPSQHWVTRRACRNISGGYFNMHNILPPLFVCLLFF